MNAATTMTDTGQVTIPESIRAAAGLRPGTPLEVSATESGGILIKQVREKKRRPLTMEQVEAARRVPCDFPWKSTDEYMAFIRGDDD